MLKIINTSLETENTNLQAQLNDKIEREVAEELNQDDKQKVEKTLNDQVNELKTELEAKKKNEREH